MTHQLSHVTPFWHTIYHSIKSYIVQWPMSQVATCDTSSVTGNHMWHGSLNNIRFYTVIYWRGYFTVDCYSKFWTKRLSLGIKEYGRKENWSNNHSVSVPKRKVFNHHHPSMPWVSRWALPCAISALSSGQNLYPRHQLDDQNWNPNYNTEII